MKLHANAALQPEQADGCLAHTSRRAGWSLTRRPRPPVSELDPAQVGRALGRPRARPACSIAPRCANRVHNRTPEDRIGVICCAAPPANDRRRDRRGPGDGSRPIVSGISLPAWPRLGLGRLAMSPRCAIKRSRPGELVHIDVKKLGRIGTKGAGHRVTGRPPLHALADRRRRAVDATPRAGSTSTSASTTPPALPTSRCSPTSGRPAQSASCGRAAQSSCARHGVTVEGGAHRQWLLPIARPST